MSFWGGGYHGDVPGLDDVNVSHQVLPGHQALHVHVEALPHDLQLLEVPVQPEEPRENVCKIGLLGIFTHYHSSPSRVHSPGHAVHRVLIGGRDQEADGRHGRLAAFVVQHPPLEGLRVVEQGALVPAVHDDLQGAKSGFL